MTSVASDLEIVIGVDTHKDTHVAVALSGLGARLDMLEFPTTAAGLASVQAWARGLGTVLAWGVEGTGSWGAGLARTLTLSAVGELVIDINRPDRHLRRMLGGKSDPSTPKPPPGPCCPVRPPRSPRPVTGSSR